MFRKFCNWYEDHSRSIETFLSVAALVELVIIALLLAGFCAQNQLLHDVEVLLAAHGVEWALYTPAP